MASVFFQTFGCQMNVADSNEIAVLLHARGFFTTGDPSAADLLVINTCSVREHAEQRAKARIIEYCGLKKRSAALWVTGCMAERLGDALIAEIPGITRVIGAKSIEHIETVIDDSYAMFTEECTGTTGEHDASAFFSIMRGCDNYCAYCIVPYVRGHETSVPVATIIERIRLKAAAGIREITLLGQNVNSYLDSGCDFPDLLHRVAEIDGIERIRFTTSHPKDCSEKLIATIAALPMCCRHFHVPMQAGADRILTAMNRRYTASAYTGLVQMIRHYLPDADVTTDILVGFPSETNEEFNETLEMVRTLRFTTAFMFAYSVREGTAAAALPDTVPKKEKLTRLRELIDLQTSITREMYASMAGKEVQLMIHGKQEKREKLWMGTDNGCKRALIACDSVKAGTILSARVISASGMTLLCERIHREDR